ncbi:hypothetical protein BGI42_03380 [Clostridium taeniosporum]|uniref:Uncharacterized protein n=2 Tax=Clostridium taeniosporum TaxID=394958 RepID=A0A1D7XI09_9CLOT|nr:hypothetical protein BGI42_03380 [Clostridium taeniosporum]
MFLGLYLVTDNIMRVLQEYIPSTLYYIIHDFMRHTPQVIIGVAIVVLGIKLVMGKKREREVDA